MSESDKHRQLGNDWYNSVRDNLSASEKAERMDKALRNYELALQTATTAQERSLTFNSIGSTSWEMSKLVKNINELVTFYQQEMMKNFSAAWHCATVGSEWKKQVETNWNQCVDEFLSWIAGVSPIRERCRCLQDIVALCQNDAINSKMLLSFTQDLFHTGFTALQRGESLECLHCMHECHLPLGRILNIGTEADKSDAQALKADVLTIVSIAESIQIIRKGDLITSSANADLANQDAMHCYRTAYNKLGKAYHTALNDSWRAKKFVALANQLSQILAPKNDLAYDCYKKVVTIVENYQQAELAAENLKMENRRKAVEEEKKRNLAAEQLKLEKLRKLAEEELKRNLEEINSADLKDSSGGVDIRKFVKRVYDRFPPKHKDNSTLTEDPAGLDQPGLKKRLKRAMVDYHPDPIDEDQYGNHYKVLCLEINKIVTNKYNCMKEV